jgi:cytochrome c peroxidase
MRNANSNTSLWALVAIAAALAAGPAPAAAQTLRQRALTRTNSLKTVLVHDQDGTAAGTIVTPDPTETALKRLGKALFWDSQLGSDGQACASCHFHAGADNRSKNQINPGFRNEYPGFEGDTKYGNSPLSPLTTPKQFGPNYQLTKDDFPLHKLSNPNDARSTLVSDTNDVISSQGVFYLKFVAPGVPGDGGTWTPVDSTRPFADMFKVGGSFVRAVPPRNTPPAVNAVFNRRNFWDSRARDEFNGVDPIGKLDGGAQIVQVQANGVPRLTAISLNNSSAASQAVGPPLSDLEMSFGGRSYPDLGRKMFSGQLHPLGQQLVAKDDSLLGSLSAQKVAPGLTGLSVTYKDLVQQAFDPQWWNAPGWRVDVSGGQPTFVQSTATGPKLFTVMEYNFQLFFGLAVQAYEKTLRADDSPFDRFMEGEETALGVEALRGLDIFLNKAKCIECHSGATLSNANIANQDTLPRQTDDLRNLPQLERMISGIPLTCGLTDEVRALDPRPVCDPIVAVYDAGFYNIGVRPTKEDVGIGGTINQPLSDSRRLVDCVTATAPAGYTPADVSAANAACDVPFILARPIEAARVLSRVWFLLNQALPTNPPPQQASDLIASAADIINTAANAAPGTSSFPLFQAFDELAQARDLLAASNGNVQDAAMKARIDGLVASATGLMPDPDYFGPAARAGGAPDPLFAWAPPLAPAERVNNMGAFKVPVLRNVELTAPYFHNGGQATLTQLIDFYDRGGDFHEENSTDMVDKATGKLIVAASLAPNVEPLHLSDLEASDLEAFLRALTDERVRFERAPFDHPSLSIPNGGTVGQSILFGGVALLDDRIELPAVGAGGHPIPLGTPGTPLANFPDPVWSQIGAASGDRQQGTPGGVLAAPLVVQVLDANGKPVAGVPVTFVAPAGASVSQAQVTTGADGKAQISARLAPGAGEQIFKAEAYAVVGSPLSITATAVATPGAPAEIPPATTPPAQTPAPVKATGGCSTGSGGGALALLATAAALLARRRRSLLGSARGLAAVAVAMSLALLPACGGGGNGGGGAGVDKARSTLTAAPASVLADGVAAATLTVTARDANGAAVAGKPVVFVVSGASNALSASQATTSGDGSASVTLTSVKAELKTVTATVAGTALTPATVGFISFAGATLCGNASVDVLNDAGNCGACGHACAASEVCGAGACSAVACTTFKLSPGTPAAIVGLQPFSVAAADLDGDGIPDLAVADFGSNTVSVSFGNGDGTFSDPLSFGSTSGIGPRPVSIAAGNLIGHTDGTLDLVVATQEPAGGFVTVLTPHPTLVYSQLVKIPVGVAPSSIAIASLDPVSAAGPDIVVANGGGDTVSVILNNGDTTFAAPATYTVSNLADPLNPIGQSPLGIAVADVNGDGKPDLLFADNLDDKVSVLLNQGNSTFPTTGGKVYPAGPHPVALAVADLDGDGNPDVAVANDPGGTVSVLLNDGAGNFTLKATLPVGTDASSVTAKDLDGDGRIDLVVANGKDDTVTVLVNQGGAPGSVSFAARTFAAGFVPFSVAVADLDKDGKLDLAVASNGGNAVTILAGLGGGNFAAPTSTAARPTYGAGATPEAVVAADLSGDGKPEIAVANGDGTVSVLRNRGDGSFSSLVSYPAGSKPSALVAADVDGDGRRDLVVTDSATGTVSVLLNQGDAALAAPVSYGVGLSPVAIAAADLNGDGAVDLVVVNQGDNTVGVLLNKGAAAPGKFQPQVTYVTGVHPTSVTAADLDGDGKLDLAVADGGDGTVVVLLNNGDGTFRRPPVASYNVGTGASSKPISIVALDLNRDGKLDLAVANNADHSVTILLNNGSGAFAVQPAVNVAESPLFMAAADLDKDGLTDLVVASGPLTPGATSHYYRAVTVLRNAGNGGVLERAYDHLLLTPLAVATADLDGNGQMDVVLLGAEGLIPLRSACAP